MQNTKLSKILSFILSLALVAGLVPTLAPTVAEAAGEEDTSVVSIYLSRTIHSDWQNVGNISYVQQTYPGALKSGNVSVAGFSSNAIILKNENKDENPNILAVPLEIEEDGVYSPSFIGDTAKSSYHKADVKFYLVPASQISGNTDDEKIASINNKISDNTYYIGDTANYASTTIYSGDTLNATACYYGYGTGVSKQLAAGTYLFVSEVIEADYAAVGGIKLKRIVTEYDDKIVYDFTTKGVDGRFGAPKLGEMYPGWLLSSNNMSCGAVADYGLYLASKKVENEWTAIPINVGKTGLYDPIFKAQTLNLGAKCDFYFIPAEDIEGSNDSDKIASITSKVADGTYYIGSANTYSASKVNDVQVGMSSKYLDITAGDYMLVTKITGCTNTNASAWTSVLASLELRNVEKPVTVNGNTTKYSFKTAAIYNKDKMMLLYPETIIGSSYAFSGLNSTEGIYGYVKAANKSGVLAINLGKVEAGAYDLSVIATKDSKGGLSDFYIIPKMTSEDAVKSAIADDKYYLGTVDYYASSTKYDVDNALKSVEVPADGEYMLVQNITGTNKGNTSNYYAFTTGFTMTKTGNATASEFTVVNPKTDSTVLGNRYAYVRKVKTDGVTGYEINLLGGVKTLDVAEVGFKIEHNGNTSYVSTNQVYEKLTVNGNEVTINNDDTFGTEVKGIFHRTATLTDTDAMTSDDVLTITAYYAESEGGEKIYGDSWRIALTK